MKNSVTGWYVASVEAPYELRLDKMHYLGWQPCVNWCTQTFGSMYSPDYPPRWRFVGEGIFEFEHEKDYILFVLRWAS